MLLAAEHPGSQFIASACLIRARPRRLRRKHSAAAAAVSVTLLMVPVEVVRNWSLLVLGFEAYSLGIPEPAVLCIVVLTQLL